MTISPVGYSPYIYNTNAVSRQSMNKISAISDDMSKSKVDYSNLVSEEANINPLKKGQSKSFVDIIASQMSLGSFQRDKLAQSSFDLSNIQTSESDSTPMLKVENGAAKDLQNYSNQMDAYSNTMNLYA